MPDRKEYGGGWTDAGWERRRDEDRRRGDERWGVGERRSFRDEGRYGSVRGGHGEGDYEPWRRDRYGSRYDQDRTNFGSGWDRERGDYGRGQYDQERDARPPRERDWSRGQDLGYATRRDERRRARQDYRQAWRTAGGAPYGDLELEAGGRGYDEYGAPHDYAYHPAAEFEPDYLHWRDEQLRVHDRHYEDWRRARQRQYDEDYRRHRAESGGAYARNIQGWHARHNISAGIPDQSIGGDIGDYHRRMPSGLGRGADQPSGALEPRGAMTPSPALGGGPGLHQADYRPEEAPQSSGEGPAFDAQPPQVRAAADGWDTRRDPEEFERRRREEMERRRRR